MVTQRAPEAAHRLYDGPDEAISMAREMLEMLRW